MIATVSLFAILFIGVFISLGEGRRPYNNSEIIRQNNDTDVIRQNNQTTTRMPSEYNTKITCNACNRLLKNASSIIIDPITIVPVSQDVPLKKKPFKAQKKNQTKKYPKIEKSNAQPNTQPEVQPETQETNQPTTYLRNGYYTQPILKMNLRGSPLVENLAEYNPPNRYCYSIMTSIKSIVGI